MSYTGWAKPTGRHCVYCGVRFPSDRRCNSDWRYTLDHVVPKSLGGVTTVPACLGCNNKKANRTPTEFFAVFGEWLEERQRKARGARGETRPLDRAQLMAIEDAERMT